MAISEVTYCGLIFANRFCNGIGFYTHHRLRLINLSSLATLPIMETSCGYCYYILYFHRKCHHIAPLILAWILATTQKSITVDNTDLIVYILSTQLPHYELLTCIQYSPEDTIPNGNIGSFLYHYRYWTPGEY